MLCYSETMCAVETAQNRAVFRRLGEQEEVVKRRKRERERG